MPQQQQVQAGRAGGSSSTSPRPCPRQESRVPACRLLLITPTQISQHSTATKCRLGWSIATCSAGRICWSAPHGLPRCGCALRRAFPAFPAVRWRSIALAGTSMSSTLCIYCIPVAGAAALPAAPQGHAIRAGEVLLSAGSYHSPMHLVSGDFCLAFPGRVVFQQPTLPVSRRGAGRPSQTPAQATSAAGGAPRQQQAEFTCRRAFDAATGTVVTLRRALEGFSAPA